MSEYDEKIEDRIINYLKWKNCLVIINSVTTLYVLFSNLVDVDPAGID